jgi:hypothetical protein
MKTIYTDRNNIILTTYTVILFLTSSYHSRKNQLQVFKAAAVENESSSIHINKPRRSLQKVSTKSSIKSPSNNVPSTGTRDTTGATTRTTSTASTTSDSFEPWTFNVFADWHGAETFVLKPNTIDDTSGLSLLSSSPSSSPSSSSLLQSNGVSNETSEEASLGESLAWTGALTVLQHIRQTYGKADLTLIVGDTNSGKWNSKEFRYKFREELKKDWNNILGQQMFIDAMKIDATTETNTDTNSTINISEEEFSYNPVQWNEFIDQLSDKDIVVLAGHNCYSTIKNLYHQAGYENLLVCVGDHELGGK